MRWTGTTNYFVLQVIYSERTIDSLRRDLEKEHADVRALKMQTQSLRAEMTVEKEKSATVSADIVVLSDRFDRLRTVPSSPVEASPPQPRPKKVQKTPLASPKKKKKKRNRSESLEDIAATVDLSFESAPDWPAICAAQRQVDGVLEQFKSWMIEKG